MSPRTGTDRSALRLCGLLLVPLLWGCAARDVTPISMTQPGDDGLSCGEIRRQISANQDEAAVLLEKNQSVDRLNAAKVVGSIVLSGWIALSIDLSREEQIKMRALADRNENLAHLAVKKGCNR